MAEVRKVAIGDEEYRIAPFRGFKGELAMSLVKRVTGEVRDVLDQVEKHEREWRAKNDLTITRELCLERIADFEQLAKTTRGHIAEAPVEEPEADAEGNRAKTKEELETEATHYESRVKVWKDQLESLGTEAFVKVPNPNGPPLAEVVLEVFPAAMEVAPRTVKQLLALVAIPNDELKQADQEDRWVEALDELGQQLFYDGLIEELMELAVVAAEVIEQAVERYRGPLGKLQALYDRATGKKKSEATEEPETTSKSESPTGSTSSPVATDGPEETSSSESDGESSLASASA
jgi:hypothetical protein